MTARLAIDPVKLRFVIITKNSARWLATVLDGYKAAGIDPFVILDAASSDDTEKLLNENAISYVTERAELPRVEDLVRRIPERVESEWVVRLDDDEFPCRWMCDWIVAKLDGLACDVVGFQRRTIRLLPTGICEYSRHPLIVSRLGVLDAQWRMFKPAKMAYVTDIHTPGFRVPAGSPVAPHKAYIAHFNWLVRTLDERRSQVTAYDTQTAGAGSRFRDVTTWEDSEVAQHSFQQMESDEFDLLAARLATTTKAR